jgi:hypothetical protein
MITIINNKIQINTRLLGGSFQTIDFNNSGHTIVESGEILNVQGQDPNALKEEPLAGMIIAKPGSVVILKNLHITESSFHDFVLSNPENKNNADLAHFFLKKGLLVLGGGTDSANEKTFSSANGQFDVLDKSDNLLDLKYGFGDHPLIIIENIKITKYGETSDVNAVTFYQTNTVSNLNVEVNQVTTTYSTNIDGLQIVTSKEDGIEVNGGNINLNNITVNSAVNDYFIVKNGHSGTINTVNFILPSSQDSRLLTLGSTDTNDAITTSNISGITIDVVDTSVTIDNNDIIYNKNTNYSGDIPDITYKSSLNFELSNGEEYELFSSVTFEGVVNCDGAIFKKGTGANSGECNVTLSGNNKTFTNMTLQACGGLVLDSLDSSNSISDITIDNSPSFGIKLLNGTVDIGGTNVISEDTNVEKDSNVDSTDRDYLILDSHQTGTINSLHNIMKSTGPDSSLIQFLETNNKSTTNFTEGGYSLSGTYIKTGGQSIFSHTSRFSGTLPNVYVKNGNTLNVSGSIQLMSDLITENGSTLLCDNNTFTNFNTNQNLNISGTSTFTNCSFTDLGNFTISGTSTTFNNNTLTNLGIINFDSQTSTFSNNSLDQCGELQITGGSANFSTLSIKDPDGQALVISGTHSGTITDLTLDLNNSNDSSIINIASGVSTEFTNTNTNNIGIFIKGDFQHSGSKSVLINRNNDTNITIPDLLIKSGDTLTLTNNLTLPSNLTVLNGGILSVSGKTISKESYASGNITINTGSSSVQTTTFSSCGLIKLVDLDNNSISNLTLNDCTGLQVDGGSVNISTVTINSASSDYLISDNHTGTISGITFDVDSDFSSKNLISLGSTSSTSTQLSGEITIKCTDTNVELTENLNIFNVVNYDTSKTFPDVKLNSSTKFKLEEDLSGNPDDYKLFSNITFEGIVNCVGSKFSKDSDGNSNCNVTLEGNNKIFSNMTLESCGSLILDTLNSTNTITNFTNTNSPTVGLQVTGGSVDVSTININSATGKYLVLSSHSGEISDSTFILPDSTTDAIIDIGDTTTTFSGTTTIKATDTSVEFDNTLNIFDINSNYTSSDIPDIVFSTPSIFRLDSESYELFSNTTFNGTVICDNSTISRNTEAKSICNITFANNNKTFTDMTLDDCGSLILNSLDNTNTISNFTNTNSPTTGFQINGGTVNVSTLNINSATEDYILSDNHTGFISGIILDVDSNFSNKNLINLGYNTLTSTNFSDDVTIKSSDTSVELNHNLVIFKVYNYDTNQSLPNIKLDNSTEFKLNRLNNFDVSITNHDFESNGLTSNGFNEDFTPPGWTESGDTSKAKRRVIINGDNAYFNTGSNGNMIGFRYGRGLYQEFAGVTGPYTLTFDLVKRRSNDATQRPNFSVLINDELKFNEDVSNSSVEQKTITWDNTESTIKIEFLSNDSGDKTAFIDNIVVSGSNYMDIDYEIFSNITFEGTVNCDESTLSRANKANSICNVTLKDDNKTFTNMILENCGGLILENVSNSSTISSFTNNSSPDIGLQITSGSINLNTVNIKDCSNDFVKLISHSGIIKDLKLNTTTAFSSKFVDIANGVTTQFTNSDSNNNEIYIKGTFNHNGNVSLIVDDDISKTIPDLVIDNGDTLVLSSNIELPSNLIVNGTITSDGKTLTATGTGNVTINSQSSLQSTTFNNCGLIKLVNLDTNSVMSSLILDSCVGMQVVGGSVDISTLTIKNATSQFLVIDSTHSGTISDVTIDTNNSHDLSFINLYSNSTTLTNVFIKGNFKHSGSKNVLIDRNNDTNITIPNLLIKSGDTFTLSNDLTLPSNLVVQSGGILSVNQKTINKESYASGNITINTGSSSLETTIFDNCGLIKLVNLDNNSTMDNLTINDSTGLQVDGGSVNITTITINNASGDYLISDKNHTGTISGLTFDVDSNFSSKNLISLGNTLNTSTTFSGEITIKCSDTNVELTEDLSIFNIINYDTSETFPDVKLNSSTEFKLDSNTNEYKLFSNIIFEGTVNCVNSKFTRDNDANSNCNVTLKGDNKIFESMILESCGTLILDTLTTNNSISNFTNTSSPTMGLQVTGGSVDVSTLNINSATGKYLVLSSHSGNISNSTFILSDSSTDAIIDIGNTNTTFSGNTIVKATDTNVEFDNNLNIFDVDSNYTSSNIPDITFNTPSIFKLESGQSYELFSNTIFNDTVICDDATISKGTEAKSICNITFANNNKTFTSMTLNNLGSLILNSLDNTNNISLTNNNSPTNGLKINGGNVNITSLTINSANNDYILSDDHTGTISSLILDVDSNFNSKNLINLGSSSSTSTTLNGEIIIKCTDTNVELTKDLNIFNVVNYDTSETFPDVKLNSSTEFNLDTNTDEYKIFSNITFEGTVNCVGSKFTLDSNGNSNCNVRLKGDNKIFSNMTLENCGTLILDTLNNTNTISSFTNTNSPTVGLQITGGSVDVSTININSASEKYLVLSSHSGVISNSTFILPDSTTDAIMDIGNTTTTFSGTTTIKATDTSVEFDNTLNIFDINSNYTSSNIPDIVFSTPSIFKLTSGQSYELFSNTTFSGTVSCDNATFSKGTKAKSICNITFANNNKTFTDMTLSSCGSLILNSLDNTNNISLTNNDSPNNGLKIDGGNVNITSLTINSANNDYLLSDDHTGTISSIIFDVDSDFSSKNLINLGSSSSTSTTLSGEITIKCTDTNVELTNDLNIFNVVNYDTSETFPDVNLNSSTKFKLEQDLSGNPDEYKLFSNITFDGTVNCVGSKFTRDSDGNSNCNVTLKGDNKIFSDMTLESCGTLILDTLNNTNTISSFTNTNSPTMGLQITEGSVDVSTLNINSATGKYLVLSSHSGVISNSTFILSDSTTDAIMDIGNTSTTFSGTTTIKATDTSVEFDNTLNIFDIDSNYTTSDIPDIVFSTPSIFKLDSESYELFSNTTFNGTVICDNSTISRGSEAKSICNITFANNNKTFTDMTLNNCGSLILNSLDNTNSISLTNNNSPTNGLKINGGNVNVTSLTINTATNDYLISDDHTGTISSIIFDVDTNFNTKKLINLGSSSSTSTTFNGEVTIKCSDSNVALTKDLDIFKITNYDVTEIIPDVKLDSSTEFNLDTNTDEYKIFSNIIFEGTVNCIGSKFTRDTSANSNCNVTLKGDNKIFENMTLESCGTLILDTLTTNNSISSFTNTSSPTMGLQVTGGSVDVSTLNINSATGKYLVLSSHSGVISNNTFILPDSTTDAIMDIGNTSTTFSGTTIIKATDTNVEFDNSLNIFDIHSSYTSSNIPDIVFNTPSKFILESGQSYELFSNTTFNGTVICDNSTISRGTEAKSICNITFANDNKTFTNMTLESCGTLILDTLSNSNTISSFTNTSSPAMGLQITGGSVDVSTLNINSATEKYLVLSSHSGVISNSTFILPDSTTDAIMDIGNTSTTFSGTTIIKATDTNVEFDNNLNIFDINSNYTSSNIPDIIFNTPSKFKLESGQSYELFSNTTFNDTVVCDNATISKGTEAKSICNITFVNNNKSFTNMTLSNLGTLILNSLDNTNSISLTNNNSPSNGLKINGGDVNITSLTINSATNDYLISDDHTGTISSIILDIDSNFTSKNLINLGSTSSTSTTFSGEITLKSSDTNVELNGNLVIFNVTNYDATETFPDVRFDNSTEFNLDTNTDEYKIFSNITFEGEVNCSGTSFSRDSNANSNCNITLQGNNKTFENVTLESCGTLILNSLNDSNTINITNNNSPSNGLKINGSNVNVTSVTINSATNEYLLSDDHTGNISEIIFDVDSNFSNKNLIDLGNESNTSTEFTGDITIKCTDTNIELNKDLNIFKVSDYDTSKTFPNVKLDSSTEFKLDSNTTEYKLFSNITFEGTVNCIESKFTKDNDGNSNCNVTLKGDNKIFSNMTLESCGTLILDTLTTNNTISSFTNTNSPTTGLQITGGSVDISTLNIESATQDYIISDDHTGTISGIILDVDSDFSNKNLINLGYTTFTSTTFSDDITIKSTDTNVEFNTNLVIFKLNDYDSNKVLPNIKLDNSTEFKLIPSSSETSVSITNHDFESNGLTSNGFNEDFTPPGWTESGDTSKAKRRVIINGNNAYFNTGSNGNMIGFRYGRGLYQEFAGYTGTYTLTFDLVKRRSSDASHRPDFSVLINDEVKFNQIVSNSSVEQKTITWNNTESTIKIEFLSNDSGDKTAFIDNIAVNASITTGEEYEIFSNITFEGTTNFDGVKIKKGTGANSECNVTLKDDNKIFTDMTLESCGALILNNVSNNSTINNFTNNSSPNLGLQITSGSVNIDTINIKDSTNEFVKLLSHSGTIKDLKLDTTNTYNKTFVEITSGVTTTFTNSDSNDNSIYIKGSFDHDGNVDLLVDNDTNKTIPDLIIDSGDTLVLFSNIKLPSNLIVNGTITSNGKTFTTTGTGNITINSQSSVQSTTFTNCGLIKLDNLDNNSVMSSLTLNNCIGLEVAGGNVNINTVTIKDASSQFLVINSSHSGTISDLTIDTNNSHDLSFINMASGVTTTFSNVFIKGTFLHSGSKNALIDRNNDANIVRPELRVSDTLTISSDMTLSSLLIVLPGGTITAESKTFTQDVDAEGGILILAGDGSSDTYEFDQLNSLGTINYGSGGSNTINSCTLSGLGTLNKYSALTLVGLTKTNNVVKNNAVNDSKDSGISLYDGDIELCSITIKDPVYNYIKTNWGHDGLVHGLTLNNTQSHTYSLIEAGDGVSKQDSGVVKTAFTNVTYTNSEADTNKNVSDQNTGTVNHGDTNTTVFKVNTGAEMYLNGIKHTTSTNAFRSSFDNQISILQRGTFTITFKNNC